MYELPCNSITQEFIILNNKLRVMERVRKWQLLFTFMLKISQLSGEGGSNTNHSKI